MSDNLVLEHLRHMRGSLDALREDMRDVKQRLGALELGVAGLRRELAGLAEADAHLAARQDRTNDRLDRIERRLDLA